MHGSCRRVLGEGDVAALPGAGTCWSTTSTRAANPPYSRISAATPRTDVFVTNGEYGGVQYALRDGLPIVTTGGKEDKPEVGARVAWSGTGLRLRTERPTPKALRRAILAVLREPRYRQASQRCSYMATWRSLR